MRGSQFLKGAVAGGVGATAVVAATAALAGSGVGGVFNLGQTNTVNETSTLAGDKVGPMLQVSNSNASTGSTGVKVTVPTGRPPFAVSSSTFVANLNADRVGYYHADELNRVGLDSNDSFGDPFGTPATYADVTIRAPKRGFVRLDGSISATDEVSPHVCDVCVTFAWLRDGTTGNRSPVAIGRIAGGGGDRETLARSFAFEADAGTHHYQLLASQVDNPGTNNGPATFVDPVLVAQFIPFGWAGTVNGGLAPP